ncbi:hypothetical protein JCM10212_002921 [Sporobolomyces blumeae]
MSLPSIPAGMSLVTFLAEARRDMTVSLRYTIVWLAILCFEYGEVDVQVALLSDERQFIWQAKWTPLKCLFLLNRYWALVNQITSTAMIMTPISSAVCERVVWFEPIGGLLVVAFSSSILALRVYSIWDRSVAIAIILGCLLLVEFGWMIGTVTQLVALKLPSFIQDEVGFHGCLAVGGPGRASGLSSAFWAAPFLFDTSILVLTIYRILSTMRQAGSVPILQRVLRHGVVYYVVICCTNFFSFALAVQPRLTIRSLNSPASLALTSAMCTRLVLSLFGHPRSLSTTRHIGSGSWTFRKPFSSGSSKPTVSRVAERRRSIGRPRPLGSIDADGVRHSIDEIALEVRDHRDERSPSTERSARQSDHVARPDPGPDYRVALEPAPSASSTVAVFSNTV